MQEAVTAKDKYKVIGPVYDLLSTLYSGRSIHNCKVAMLNPQHLQPGDRILFAGVGHGKDAIHAAELGAQVTVVDLSETMLRKFQEQLDRENKQFRYPIRKLHLDIETACFRSEEHTSELQSRENLVCRLLLEK